MGGPIRFVFVYPGVFEDGGSNGAISGWIKFKVAADDKWFLSCFLLYYGE